MRFYFAPSWVLLIVLLCRAAIGQQPTPATTGEATLVPSDVDSLWAELDRLQVRLTALEDQRREGVIATDFAVEQPAPAPSEPAGTANLPCAAPCGTWDGGASLYVLSPRWTGGNVAYLSSDILFTEIDQQNFGSPLSAAPAVWLGYSGPSGCGVQTDFFQFSQSVSQTTLAPAGDVLTDPYGNVIAAFGAPFHSSSSLDILYWDLVVSKRIELDDWTWTASAGLRYLHLKESYEADFIFTSAAQHTFDGWGPTAALSGRRPIGSWGWGVYGNCRASLLFGPQDYLTAISDGLGDEVDVRNNGLGVMPTAELEWGVDCQRPLFGGRATLMFQTGIVAQVYFDAGTPSAISPLNNPTTGIVTTSSLDATLGLFGFRSSLGIAF